MAKKQLPSMVFRLPLPTTVRALLGLAVAIGCPCAVIAQAPNKESPLEKAWYTPVELLTTLAKRDGIQWVRDAVGDRKLNLSL